ncbi:MAG: AMP-binding protein [Dongiaceae bacterium]
MTLTIGHEIEAIDLARLLGPWARARPDDPALVTAEESLGWRDLDRASRAYAAGLLALGLRPGERAASLMPNCSALLVHYLACLRAGIVAVPLNYRYTPREIGHGLAASGASVLLAHAERDADLAACPEAGRLRLGVIRHPHGTGGAPGFAALAGGAAPDAAIPAPAAADPAFIFFTSGSTGPAKGVTHSGASLGAQIAAVLAAREIGAADIVLTGASLSHIGALTDALMAMAAGARLVIPRRFDGAEILPLLRAHRPTMLHMLAPALFALVREHGAARADFASVRLCLSGGDKVPGQLARRLQALAGLDVHEQYGMTETGISTVNPPHGVNKIGSVGRPMPGFEVAIRDAEGRDLPVGAEGRLWVRSPGNMIGYWGDPAATRATLREGWLDTGDVMRLDADGYLWFCGRQKQIIVHDGSNISPQEVEEALLEHPAVAMAGAVGVRNLLHGENVDAFVALRDGAPPPGEAELIAFARERIGYKAPEHVFLLDRLPQTPTGKLDRGALKQLAAERHAGAVDFPSSA